MRFSSPISTAVLLLTLVAAGTALSQTTQWLGFTSDWRAAANWNNGIPDETKDVIINNGSSNGRFDPIVPAPLGGDTARVKNLAVQNGGRLTFAAEPGGFLIVWGTDRLTNEGTIVLGNGHIVFKNNITFLHGGTFDAGSGTLVFQGVTWNNMSGSTFIPGTSTVVFDGESNQTVNGNISFYNLEVNTEGTVTFTGFATIDGSLTLSPTSSISGGTSGTWRVEGTLTKEFTGTETGIQLLLSDQNYIDILAPGITSMTLRSFPGVAPPELPSSADTTRAVRLRYYRITDVQGTGLVTIRLDYLPAEMGSQFTQTSASLWRKAALGQPWVDQTAELAGSNFVEKIALPVSSLEGYYSIAEGNAALPITLVSFTGSVVNTNDVQLEWMTVSEINNLGFYVERRLHGEATFTELPNSFVPGAGTTIEPQFYTWTDVNVAAGTYEYRLRQVDLSGSSSHTYAVEVIVSGPLSVGGEAVPAVFTLNQNYPNPFNPSTKISFSLAEANFTTVKVYNVLGQQVATLFSGMADAGRAYVVNFNASTLGNGIYFYRLESGSKVDVKKMTLLK
jgi:hypothetical protein